MDQQTEFIAGLGENFVEDGYQAVLGYAVKTHAQVDLSATQYRIFHSRTRNS